MSEKTLGEVYWGGYIAVRRAADPDAPDFPYARLDDETRRAVEAGAQAVAARRVREALGGDAGVAQSITVRAPLPGEDKQAYEAYLATLFAPVREEMSRLRAGLENT